MFQAAGGVFISRYPRFLLLLTLWINFSIHRILPLLLILIFKAMAFENGGEIFQTP